MPALQAPVMPPNNPFLQFGAGASFTKANNPIVKAPNPFESFGPGRQVQMIRSAQAGSTVSLSPRIASGVNKEASVIGTTDQIEVRRYGAGSETPYAVGAGGAQMLTVASVDNEFAPDLENARSYH